MKTITFFNNKGGVGKTTTIVNLASYLQKYKGKRVLLVDLDPQSNSTQAVIPQEQWVDYYDPCAVSSKKTIFNCFKNIRDGDTNIEKIDIPVTPDDGKYGVWLLPGHPKMSIIDDEMSKSWQETLSGNRGGIRKLNWLNQLKNCYKDDFDYMLIDVGPSLGALNRSALLNSDYFFTPMASDIFSLWGVTNIGEWMDGWTSLYSDAIERFYKNNNKKEIEEFFNEKQINVDITLSTRYVGYSIQQYSKRTFKTGERATAAYERVISEFHNQIKNTLNKFIKKGLRDDDLKIGDIPYVYSVIPLSQTANCPIFNLTYQEGLRGNQKTSVEKYKKYLENISKRLMFNVDRE